MLPLFHAAAIPYTWPSFVEQTSLAYFHVTVAAVIELLLLQVLAQAK